MAPLSLRLNSVTGEEEIENLQDVQEVISSRKIK